MPHRPRVPHDRHCPVHVTLRASTAVPSLRRGRLLGAAEHALAAASTSRFRVLQYSVQADHLHLVVEANGPTEFERGVRGLAIRVAKAVNRVLDRHGPVWGDRFHARLLRTPREVRNTLVYVLNNFRKHVPGAQGLDPCSSARWFDGWRATTGRVVEASPLARASTWLARVGWRRHGLIDVDECPRALARFTRTGQRPQPDAKRPRLVATVLRCCHEWQTMAQLIVRNLAPELVRMPQPRLEHAPRLV
jgi:putative transposase